MVTSPLFRKLFLPIAALGVGIAVGLVLMMLRWERGRLEAEAETRLRQAAALLRPLALEVFTGGEASEVRNLAEAARVRLTMVNMQGQVLVDTAVAPEELMAIENHRNRPEIAAALKTGLGTALRWSATTHAETRYFADRVEASGTPIGVLRVAQTTAEVTTQLVALRKQLTLWAAWLVGALLLAAYYLASQIAQPANALRATAVALAAGDYAQRASIPTADELGEVGDALNRLSAELGSQQSELRRSGQRQATILSGMVEGVIAVDRRQNILFANPAAGKLFDFVPPKAEGRPVIELIRNHNLARMLSLAIDEAAPKWTELAWGKLLLTAQITPLPGSPCPGAVVVLHDITDLRRLESLRRDFIANVSHELKTPLASIKAYAETLLSGALEDPPHNKLFVERIAEQADRLNYLIHDMLSLARIESEAAAPELARVEVAEAVAATLAIHASAAEAKSLTLTATAPPEPLFVRAEAEGLRDLVSNLIDNAVKYTQPSGRIEVRWRQAGERVALEVADNGPGIPADQMDRVFERFYRVDKARSRELGGTGLGLAIVKHLAESFGGAVSVAATPGGGATFCVELLAA